MTRMFLFSRQHYAGAGGLGKWPGTKAPLWNFLEWSGRDGGYRASRNESGLHRSLLRAEAAQDLDALFKDHNPLQEPILFIQWLEKELTLRMIQFERNEDRLEVYVQTA